MSACQSRSPNKGKAWSPMVHFLVGDVVMEIGLSCRILTGNRKKYKRKFIDGITYVKIGTTIADLRLSEGKL